MLIGQEITVLGGGIGGFAAASALGRYSSTSHRRQKRGGCNSSCSIGDLRCPLPTGWESTTTWRLGETTLMDCDSTFMPTPY